MAFPWLNAYFAGMIVLIDQFEYVMTYDFDKDSGRVLIVVKY